MKRDHPHRDVRPLDDVGEDELEGEPLIEDDVGEQVQRRVEEREQPEHAAVLNDPLPAGEPPERRDRQRDEQPPQRPDAGRERDVLDGIGAETSVSP